MDENMVMRVEDDLDYLKSKKAKLQEFNQAVEDFGLSEDVERKVISGIKKEIEMCETEIEQISYDLEINELKCDLVRKD